jgi:hypothetical protein
VEKARYSDPQATDYMTATLIKRRDKVLSRWLNGVNPVVDPVLGATGMLTFGNAAVAAGVAEPPESYSVQWFELDNATDDRRDVGAAQTIRATEASAPPAILDAKSEYIGVVITAQHAQQPAWKRPATFYFRRTASGWAWVGAER